MKTSELAAQKLAERIEKKYEDRAWKELIRKAEKKGALIHDNDPRNNGPTGHGDICISDADPGL